MSLLEVLEHGSQRHRDMAMSHILAGLLEYAMSEQGIKSITKALKEGGKDTLDRVIRRMCEPAKRYVFLIYSSLQVHSRSVDSAVREGP